MTPAAYGFVKCPAFAWCLQLRRLGHNIPWTAPARQDEYGIGLSAPTGVLKSEWRMPQCSM
eukprot:855556-Pleurochrysis_carterae.AAC.1